MKPTTGSFLKLAGYITVLSAAVVASRGAPSALAAFKGIGSTDVVRVIPGATTRVGFGLHHSKKEKGKPDGQQNNTEDSFQSLAQLNDQIRANQKPVDYSSSEDGNA